MTHISPFNLQQGSGDCNLICQLLWTQPSTKQEKDGDSALLSPNAEHNFIWNWPKFQRQYKCCFMYIYGLEASLPKTIIYYYSQLWITVFSAEFVFDIWMSLSNSSNFIYISETTLPFSLFYKIKHFISKCCSLTNAYHTLYLDRSIILYILMKNHYSKY